MMPTRIASVPITPVSMYAYGPTPGMALSPSTMLPRTLTLGVFSSSFSPMMSASSPASVASSLSRCRVNSFGWSASAPQSAAGVQGCALIRPSRLIEARFGGLRSQWLSAFKLPSDDFHTFSWNSVSLTKFGNGSFYLPVINGHGYVRD